MDANLKRFVHDRLGISTLAEVPRRYPYQLVTFECPGSAALGHWQKLSAAADQLEHWPVILGNDKEARRVLEIQELAPQQILDEAATLNSGPWLAAREASQKVDEESLRASFEKRYGPRAEQMWEQLVDLKNSAPQQSLHGEWPEKPQPLPNFTIPFERVGNGPPKAKVTIALFPTKHAWEVPAFANVGGWNECPEPAGHVVMMRHWFEQYGAELVGMNGDTVEMNATRPPQTREAALKLAKEQYLYCEDIVVQGTQTIEALAASLLGHNIWFFWWD